VLETVTPETYIRAETDRSFRNIVQLNGGAVNTFYHFRQPTPLDKQTVVRMNKDTLYSGAIVDTSGGATVALPRVSDGRYMSILLVDNDHYCPEVFYAPGVHELPKDTKYLAVLVRTQLLNADDPAEIAVVNKLQDHQRKERRSLSDAEVGRCVAEGAHCAIREGLPINTAAGKA
jgi:Protein of unknown function (DUF1254)